MYRTHYGTNVVGLVFQVTLMIMIQVVVPLTPDFICNVEYFASMALVFHK